MEKTIDKIEWTVVRDYDSIKSLMKITIPFSVKLTNEAIYSYVFWIIPVGKISLRNIIEFKVIKNEMVGLGFFKQGILIKSHEDNKIRQVVFFVWKSRLDSFVSNLLKVGVNQEK